MKLSEETSPLSSLIEQMEELKEEILKQVLPFGVHKGTTEIICRPLSARAMHNLASVELRNNGNTVHCFAKKTAANYHGPQRLDREAQILRQVTPKIWAANKQARSPQVLAFFPEQQLLLLEFVNGTPLKNLVFNRNIPHFVRLAGEWIARLHTTTRTGEADPFTWLEAGFTDAKVRTAFQQCSAAALYDPLQELLRHFHRQFSHYQQPLCLVHGEFTSLHVLTKEDNIYVIDFGSSRTGFGCEDVAFFSTFYEALLPWRQLAGYVRYPLNSLSKIFLHSYFKHYGQSIGPAEDIVLRFANIRAMALHASCWEGDRQGWAPNLYSRIMRQWIRRRLGTFVRQEFRSLEQIASAGLPVHTSN